MQNAISARRKRRGSFRPRFTSVPQFLGLSRYRRRPSRFTVFRPQRRNCRINTKGQQSEKRHFRLCALELLRIGRKAYSFPFNREKGYLTMKKEPLTYENWIKNVSDQTVLVLWSMFVSPSEEPITDIRKAVLIQTEMEKRNLLPETFFNQQ